MTLDRTIAPALHWEKKIALPPCLTKQAKGIPFTFFLDSDSAVLGLRLIFPRIDAVGRNQLVGRAAMEMLLRGSKTKTEEELFYALEVLGVRVHTSANVDYDEVSLRTSIRNLDAALALLHEILFTPRMAQDDLTQWIEESKTDFAINLEDPAYLAARAFRQSLYGKEHFYGELIQPELYESLTLDQVLHYWQENIVKNIPAVIVTGGLEKEQEADLIATLTSWGFTKNEASLHYGVLHPETGIVRSTVPSGTQVSMYMGCLLPRHPFEGEYDLRIAIALLGGVFSSRLMQNLREDKGYTYGIHSKMAFLYDTGRISIRTNVGNAYAAKAIEEIRNELCRMLTNPASEQELDVLRGQLFGDAMQALDGVWNASASMFIYAAPIEAWYEKARKRIEAISSVDADAIVAIAQKWLQPERFLLSVAGQEEVVNTLQWPLPHP